LKPSLIKRIKPLSIQLANQIAAGEVVERPASVLKELLENSIDAGSSEIEVDIIQGGKSLIRIKDNGWGIKKEDLPLAVSRHATSKLSVIEDLDNVDSLGFRGEALASISSISRLSIVSKFENNDKAWSIDTASDTDFTNYQADVLPAALSAGTVIEVRDLFYNTPARRKFLRTDKTEFRYIEDVFKRIALSHFDISFKLNHNKKLIKKLSLDSSSKGKLFRLQKIFGENFVQQLKEVNQTSQNFQDLGCLQLSGWISNQSYVRSYADQQFFYVNGRYVRDKLLNHALRQAYQEILQEDQYAAYILYLSIDPSYVDVNVHPTKHEIRFTQSRMVHDFVVSAISRTLSPAIINSDEREIASSVATTSTTESHQQPLFDNSIAYSSFSGTEKKHSAISDIKEHIYATNSLYKKTPTFPQSEINDNNQQLPSFVKPFLNDIDKPVFNGKILTLMGSTLIAQENDKLWLVEVLGSAKTIKHQLLLEQILNSSDSNNSAGISINGFSQKLNSQKLIIPENVNLTNNGCDLLAKWQQLLTIIGLEFSFSGPENIMLRAVPKVPFDLDNQLVITSIVNLLATTDPETNDNQFDQLLIKQLLKKIANSLNSLQIMDKNKQQLILSYVSDSIHSENQLTQDYKKNYQILKSEDINKLIK